MFLGPISSALVAAGNLRRMGDAKKARGVLAIAFVVVPLFLLAVIIWERADEAVTLLLGHFITGFLLLSSQKQTFKQWRNENPSSPLSGATSAWTRSLAGAAIYALMLTILFGLGAVMRVQLRLR